ncbi:hypothetical protein GCM10027589_54120 [Actinocorallia lasiicapitis]
MSPLELRYRRLLRWFPGDHRAEYEEEMLGVLLAAGPPTRRDALDLVVAGLVVRFRGLPAELRRPEWRDAAAVVSLLVSLLLGALAVRYAVMAPAAIDWVREQALPWIGTPGIASFFMTAPYWLAAAVCSVAALAGARRTGLVFAVVALAFLLQSPVGSGYYTITPPALLVSKATGPLFLLTALAAWTLHASDGPRRGLAVLGVRRAVAAGLVVAGSGTAIGWLSWDRTVDAYALLAAVAVCGLALALLLGRTDVGRRVLVLLALPFATAPLMMSLPPAYEWAALAAPPLALLGAVLVSQRSRKSAV